MIDRRSLLGVLAFGLSCHPALAATALTFRGLYKSFGVRGLVFSDAVLALQGKNVTMTGFMAPPLKAESDFFVLTAEPMALCPFCQSDADWPVDIVMIKARRRVEAVSFDRRIMVVGQLEVGPQTDSGTGFVSQIRIVDAGFTAA